MPSVQEDIPETCTHVETQSEYVHVMKRLAGRIFGFFSDHIEILVVGRAYRPYLKHERPEKIPVLCTHRVTNPRNLRNGMQEGYERGDLWAIALGLRVHTVIPTGPTAAIIFRKRMFKGKVLTLLPRGMVSFHCCITHLFVDMWLMDSSLIDLMARAAMSVHHHAVVTSRVGLGSLAIGYINQELMQNQLNRSVNNSPVVDYL